MYVAPQLSGAYHNPYERDDRFVLERRIETGIYSKTFRSIQVA